MIELGNQIIRDINKSAKEYYSNLKMRHISIDINGKNGSIPLDLRTEIKDKRIKPCDILTNIGTTEHVTGNISSQYMCFKNIHNFVKKGGFFFHLLPPKDNWIGHCKVYYTQSFFYELAVKNKYKIIEHFMFPYKRNHPKSLNKNKLDLLLCIMRKEDNNKFVHMSDWTPPLELE